MLNNLDKYSLDIKNKLDKRYLSPLFIRLANLLYINEKYEDCIIVCKTGLEIYPQYLTAKLILLKALLKAEYLNEAEILFGDIKDKIPDDEMYLKLKGNIENLKNISGQEKIYYLKSGKTKFDFKSFEKKFLVQGNLFTDFKITEFLENDLIESSVDKSEFDNFMKQFNLFHFEKEFTNFNQPKHPDTFKLTPGIGDETLLSRVKIVTETLADLYAAQGNFKEAFDAYNILLRAGTPGKKRIEEKLHELERNMFKNEGF